MAASFVRQVLSATGKLGEKEDYAGKAARLTSSIDKLKAGLRERIEARYVDFSASFAEVSQQIAHLDEVLREIEILENSIQHHLKPGVNEASRETTELLRQLKELTASARNANHIREVYEMMETSDNLIDRKQFTEATAKLRLVEEAVRRPFSADQDEETSKALKSIKLELQTAQEKIRFTLCKEWDQMVNIVTEECKSTKLTIKTIILGVSDGKDIFENLVQAMQLSETLEYRINKFGAKLMQEIVQIILTTRVEEMRTIETDFHTLVLKFEQESGETRPDPKEVLQALEQVFQFVGDAFDVPISEKGVKKTLMQCLGETGSATKLKDLLIKDCIGPAVPSSKEGLENYEQVIRLSEALQSVLFEVNFFSPEDCEIMKYAQNVDATFANKRCQTLLVKGRNIMKEDLHTTVVMESAPEIEVKDLEDTTTFRDIDPSFDEDMLPLPKGMSLDKTIFTFPKCQVSKSVFKLVDLVKETLEEACSNDATPFYAGRALVTARNLIEMYCDVIPVFHAESLKQFPQHSGLVYNNCFYLAHVCLTLGLSCSDRLRPPFNSRSITFADLVPRLRQTGIDVFLMQMRRQRDDIRTILKDSSIGFGQLTGSELLPATTEKGIKQILHQLHHLRKLWQDVLPRNVYCKTIGTLFNTVIEDITHKVVVLEDIAADSATQLCTLFTTLTEKGPDIFVLDGQPDSSRGDVIRYVRRWNKFKELIQVLNASLREIDDRWASGKGPLAVEFSPDEVKRLIRALFQNTDRRAAVLSRIKFES